jgi:hypothetical protein
VERVHRHWWNGSWGRLARRDVYVWFDGYRRWAVEARSGGAEGTKRRQAVHDEHTALELAKRWRDLGGREWKDITRAHGERDT